MTNTLSMMLRGGVLVTINAFSLTQSDAEAQLMLDNWSPGNGIKSGDCSRHHCRGRQKNGEVGGARHSHTGVCSQAKL